MSTRKQRSERNRSGDRSLEAFTPTSRSVRWSGGNAYCDSPDLVFGMGLVHEDLGDASAVVADNVDVIHDEVWFSAGTRNGLRGIEPEIR